MPAPQHMRLIFSGTFGAPETATEDWQFGLSAEPVAVANPATDLTPYTDAAAAFWDAIKGLCSQAVYVTNIRAAIVGPDGKYTRTADGQYVMKDVASAARGGGAAALAFPSQVSLAVTLESDYPGPHGRGRFYLPGPGGTLDASGRLPVATRDSYLTTLQTGLGTLETTLNGTAPFTQLVVASGGSVTRGIAPGLHPVARVGLGLRMDVQRRRAADIPEERVALPVPF